MNGQTQFTKIVKRNGDVAEFRPEKIEQAIFKAMRAAGRPDRAAARSGRPAALMALKMACSIFSGLNSATSPLRFTIFVN